MTMTRMVRVRISVETKRRLDRRRLYPREPYSRVVERLLHDWEDSSPASIRRYNRIAREVQRGRFKTNEEVKRELGI